MDVAVYHDLPSGGGAYRVLAEFVSRTTADRVTVYTRQPEPQRALVELHERARIVRGEPLPELHGERDRIKAYRSLDRLGREMAERIDAGGHDVVFCHLSAFVGAPEVLPHLRTPSLFYVPEQLRAAYDAFPPWERDDSWKGRLARRNLGPVTFLRKRADQRHIRGADLVVAHSQWTARRLRECYGIDAEVVLLAVDSDAFAPGSAPRDDFVLSVGALHPLKGHQFVVEAIATLPQPRPRLVVVGDRGHAGTSLVALAAERGVALDLRQGITFAELVELYRRAGVHACGQYEEPFGLTTLEAMATATPVVAVAEGGFPETVRDGETGLLVARDPTGFGRAIARVLGDSELARRMGSAGRADTEERWQWHQTVREYDRLLARLATRRPAVPASRDAT
jgi:glycosyltransferase involved in cell wall biosynthesis